MHEDGIFRSPRCDGAVHFAGKQSFTFTVVAVERHFVYAERTESALGRYGLVGSHFWGNFQYARGLQQIVPLRGIIRIGYPFFGNVCFFFRETAGTSIVAFYMDIGQEELGRVTSSGRFRFGKS